jgi:dUTP pyrophosphatase
MKKIKLTGPGLIPTYAKEGDAGCDLHYYGDSPTYIGRGQTRLIRTGIFLEIPKGYEAQVRPRSGLALNKSITVLNTPGTIDSGYRNEIKVILINHSQENFTINPNDRIAQLVFNKVETAKFVRVDELSDSERGIGGFGSTGVRPNYVPSFWYMKDDHTFIKPKGNNLDEIKKDLLRIAKAHPYGMVCPVIIMTEDSQEEVKRVGPSAHVNGDGNVDLSKWYEEILKEDCIKNYKKL